MTDKKKITPDELFVQLLTGDRYRPLRHVALGVMLLGLGLGNVNSDIYGSWMWILTAFILVPLPIILNVYVFVPKIFLRNHPYQYTLALVSIVLLCLLAGNYNIIRDITNSSDLLEISESQKRYFILNAVSTLMMFALILAGTNSIIILQLWLRDRIRIAELEEASNIAELELLKNQINPHFLFNMLNNAMVLTKENSSQAKEVILKLREMLNYQFEMSNIDKIPLRGDIDFLDDLMHLEQIRRDNFDYRILILGTTDNIMVPPLMFIPFVENAIKHGNDNTRPSYILLVFNIDGNKLNFFCTNSIPSHAVNPETGGLGLKNIKRRLELIYGNDHCMDINVTSQIYNINLTIEL